VNVAENLFYTGLKMEPPSPCTFIWGAVGIYQKVRSVWKTYSKGIIYSNPQNWLPLAGGYFLDYATGSNVILKIPTVPFFLTVKFLDYVKAKNDFDDQINNFKMAFSACHPLYSKYTKKYYLNKISNFRYRLCSVRLRLQRICKEVFFLIAKTFSLWMRIADLLDVITLDSSQLDQMLKTSVRESFINIDICLKAIKKNKYKIIQIVESKGFRKGLKTGLKFLGFGKVGVESVISNTKTFFEFLDKVSVYYTPHVQLAGEALATIGETFVSAWTPSFIKNPEYEQSLKDRVEAVKQKLSSSTSPAACSKSKKKYQYIQQPD
jgi:hypothetical protein